MGDSRRGRDWGLQRNALLGGFGDITRKELASDET